MGSLCAALGLLIHSMHCWHDLSTDPPDRDEFAVSALTCFQLLRGLEHTYHARLRDCLDGFELDVFDSILLTECHTSDCGTAAQRDFAAAKSTSAAKISMRLEALRKRGILESWRPADDRRRQCWRVTPLGRQLVQELNQRIGRSFGGALLETIQTLAAAVSRSLADKGPTEPGSQHSQPRVA